MKGLKFPLTLLVVLMLVTTVFTPARADAVLPEGFNLDDPLSYFESATVLPDDYAPAENLVLADITAPYPLAPISGSIIMTKLPKLYFAHNNLATAYKVYMYDVVAGITLAYTYIGGTENCGTAYCWLQPTTKLKPLKNEATAGGLYIWKVEAEIGGVWVANSNTAVILVLTPGFTSTFDSSTKGWGALNGTWSRTSSGYYKTLGSLGTNVNAWKKDVLVSDNLVIEVRMKRKTETGSASRIWFLGYPKPLVNNNHWDDGYMFNYYNDGNWSLWKAVSGTETFINSGSTPYAESFTWNTFKFWISEGYIHLWINDIYMGSTFDTAQESGSVGLSSYEGASDKSPLLVDYVKVYYSPIMPQSISVEGAAVENTAVEIGGGGDYLIK